MGQAFNKTWNVSHLKLSPLRSPFLLAELVSPRLRAVRCCITSYLFHWHCKLLMTITHWHCRLYTTFFASPSHNFLLKFSFLKHGVFSNNITAYNLHHWCLEHDYPWSDTTAVTAEWLHWTGLSQAGGQTQPENIYLELVSQSIGPSLSKGDKKQGNQGILPGLSPVLGLSG